MLLYGLGSDTICFDLDSLAFLLAWTGDRCCYLYLSNLDFFQIYVNIFATGNAKYSENMRGRSNREEEKIRLTVLSAASFDAWHVAPGSNIFFSLLIDSLDFWLRCF